MARTLSIILSALLASSTHLTEARGGRSWLFLPRDFQKNFDERRGPRWKNYMVNIALSVGKNEH